MLTSRNIRVLHLEPTDVCQAACPQCARETDPIFDRDSRHHLSVEQLQNLLPPKFITDLDKMFMCGNYGDPAAGRHTLDIYKWFRSINPKITLGMNTNGAIGNEQWWHDLGKILCLPLDYVVFSIDGLADTNSLYRINVNWHKLMANVSAFVSAGGSAHWEMLVYQHNEHQVADCEQLARNLGFTWFRTKISRRPLTANLQIPVSWQVPPKSAGPIRCHILEEQSIYIDAQARISPCCWLGSRQQDFVTDFEEIQRSWASANPDEICRSTCGTVQNTTAYHGQWQKNIQLC